MKYIFSIFFTLSTLTLCALSGGQGILGTYLQDDRITIPDEVHQENHTLPVNEIEFRRHHSSSGHRNHKNQNRNEAVYGSFSTTQSVAVDAGSSIAFSTTDAVSENGIQLSAEGQILISQPGDYLVSFGAAVLNVMEPASANRIALSLNGVFPVIGTNIDVNSFGTIGSASTILHIGNVSLEQPATLAIVNNSTFVGSSFILGSSTTGDVSAYLSIDKLSE